MHVPQNPADNYNTPCFSQLRDAGGVTCECQFGVMSHCPSPKFARILLNHMLHFTTNQHDVCPCNARPSLLISMFKDAGNTGTIRSLGSQASDDQTNNFRVLSFPTTALITILSQASEHMQRKHKVAAVKWCKANVPVKTMLRTLIHCDPGAAHQGSKKEGKHHVAKFICMLPPYLGGRN